MSLCLPVKDLLSLALLTDFFLHLYSRHYTFSGGYVLLSYGSKLPLVWDSRLLQIYKNMSGGDPSPDS